MTTDIIQMQIGGQSAGAHACGAHLQHRPTDEFKPPFSQVIMNSGGPTARAWPDWTYELYNKQMDEFLVKTNCKQQDGDEHKTFDCLRKAKAAEIEDARFVQKES
jgi:acetylcholinesterase